MEEYSLPGIHFSLSGLKVEGDPETNLCIKAYRLLKKDYPQLPSIQLLLHKVIPAGAGLGGGSADGAFTLKLLNDKYHLAIPEEKLLNFALQLGSDCPFFIKDTPCFATGRGELLQPVELVRGVPVGILFAGAGYFTARKARLLFRSLGLGKSEGNAGDR
jgi:4-diphosphocytidyl-2-C-methyl-D-erythritol kinase